MLAIPSLQAQWFLPFVLPLCLYVAYTDLSRMKITNKSVLALALIFVVIGFFLMPFSDYLWRMGALLVVLIMGIILNGAGAMGAGDAKFIAAAAPYIALGDLRLLMAIFASMLLAAFVTHRTVRLTPLRQIAPNWESWDRKKFPMGFALGPTLALYLILGALYGA
ncbi:MAG: prepilin peptidase [Pseudomonadota bacterium]